MNGIPVSSEILGAMITPAVLISASGVLVLSTSNRVGRTVDRVRALATEVERLQLLPESGSVSSGSKASKRKRLADQLSQLSERAVLLRSAMRLYTAPSGSWWALAYSWVSLRCYSGNTVRYLS
jgi:Protein of unknown function (DUF2721)